MNSPDRSAPFSVSSAITAGFHSNLILQTGSYLQAVKVLGDNQQMYSDSRAGGEQPLPLNRVERPLVPTSRHFADTMRFAPDPKDGHDFMVAYDQTFHTGGDEGDDKDDGIDPENPGKSKAKSLPSKRKCNKHSTGDDGDKNTRAFKRARNCSPISLSRAPSSPGYAPGTPFEEENDAPFERASYYSPVSLAPSPPSPGYAPGTPFKENDAPSDEE